jgi:hypothetical protein
MLSPAPEDSDVFQVFACCWKHRKVLGKVVQALLRYTETNVYGRSDAKKVYNVANDGDAAEQEAAETGEQSKATESYHIGSMKDSK